MTRLRRALQVRRRAPGWPAWTMLFWWNFVRSVLRVSLQMAYRFRARGEEYVPASGPIIYVANHQSHFDPVIVGIVVGDRPFSGMARATLFKNPLLAWIMRGIGVIALDQTKGDMGAMRAALGELDAGRCVLIFPEGSRTRNGAIAPFKPGVALLIKRSGAPVVPVAIEGAYDVWPIGAALPKLTGRIAVQAGRPIPNATLMQEGPEGALAHLHAAIDFMRLGLRAEMRRQTAGRFPPPGAGDVRAVDAAPRMIAHPPSA